MPLAATVGENPLYRPFRRVLPQLLFLAFIFFLNFLSRIIFSPLLPRIEQELDFSHAVSGSFFLCISTGYFVSILLSGFVSSRLTHKGTIVFSTIATGSSLAILGHCDLLFNLRLALFGLGLAAGLYLPSGLAVITRMVSPAYWGRGMAVHEIAPNVGFVVAPLICGFMVERFSWRSGIEGIGVVLILVGLLYLFFGEGGGARGCPPQWAVLKNFLGKSRFWLMILLFSLAICSTLGIYAMLPLLLVTGQGMDGDAANRLIALSRLCTIIMPVPAGWLGDRFGNLRVMIAVLLLAGLLTLPLGLLSGIPLLIAVFLQPLIAVCFFPSGFAVLSTTGGVENGSAAIALCIPLAFLLGGGVMPTLIGFIGDHFQLGAGFVAAGLAMSLAALIAASLLSRKERC